MIKNNEFIPLSIPNINGNELKYVTEAINTQWVSTAGGSIIKFEKEFADYLNVGHACACQSGTAGLHLCLRHFGIKKGDIVLVPTLTFIATINAVMYQDAVPMFFDCDDKLCINVEQIKKYIEKDCDFGTGVLIDKKTGYRIKAIIPVHVFGDACDMDGIMELAEYYNLVVIEDATESLGTLVNDGKYKGMYTGTIGHAGVFSFNGNKIITTGGGGMIVSNSQEVIKHMNYLSQQAKDDVIYFVHDEVGYNYRMTNLQAALGLGQLEQLEKFIEIKKSNYDLYQSKLEKCKLGELLEFRTGRNSNFWFYSFKMNDKTGNTRDRIIRYLNENNVQVRPIWKLNHTQKPFVEFSRMEYPNAECFYNTVINLPCSSNLQEFQIEKVCNLLMEFEETEI